MTPDIFQRVSALSPAQQQALAQRLAQIQASSQASSQASIQTRSQASGTKPSETAPPPQPSSPRLVAYVTLQTQAPLHPTQPNDLPNALKTALKAQLPDYMVPTVVMP